jgi:hypothetical protein
MMEGGPALAEVQALGGPEMPLIPADPLSPPPIDEQTILDQMSGDIEGALQAQDAQEQAEGAGIDQQEAEKEAILQLMAIAEGRP